MGILARQNAVGQECPTWILRRDKALVRLSQIRPQRPRAVGEADGELKIANHIPPILPGSPPKAAMREEWAGSWDVARLALHLLHHPGELDGVAELNLRQSNSLTETHTCCDLRWSLVLPAAS